MKKIFLTLFDLIFPRRPNDAAIFGISPEVFYKKTPRWGDGDIYPNMRAIFHYQDPTSKAMIKELKSSKSLHAAKIAAFALANLVERTPDMSDSVIVPMPISKQRRKKRGYNQCELLAESFIREIESRGVKGSFEIRTDILEKTVDTAKLALKNRAARLNANKGVFNARCPLSSCKKRIIVIDDVITTGSTMRSAMDALRDAGAKWVTGIGIAH